MTNDGPRVHTQNRLREQAGFRGRDDERNGAVELELTRDDSVCAPVAEYMLVPARATQISLQCVLAVPSGHPTLSAPVLVCRWMGSASSEQDAHIVDGIGPDRAIVLGSGAGLVVKVEGTPPSLTGSRLTVTTATPGAPLADDAWATAP